MRKNAVERFKNVLIKKDCKRLNNLVKNGLFAVI